jgi:hypothetical protein
MVHSRLHLVRLGSNPGAGSAQELASRSRQPHSV